MGPITQEEFENEYSKVCGISKKEMKRLGYYAEFRDGRWYMLKK